MQRVSRLLSRSFLAALVLGCLLAGASTSLAQANNGERKQKPAQKVTHRPIVVPRINPFQPGFGFRNIGPGMPNNSILPGGCVMPPLCCPHVPACCFDPTLPPIFTPMPVGNSPFPLVINPLTGRVSFLVVPRTILPVTNRPLGTIGNPFVINPFLPVFTDPFFSLTQQELSLFRFNFATPNVQISLSAVNQQHFRFANTINPFAFTGFDGFGSVLFR